MTIKNTKISLKIINYLSVSLFTVLSHSSFGEIQSVSSVEGEKKASSSPSRANNVKDSNDINVAKDSKDDLSTKNDITKNEEKRNVAKDEEKLKIELPVEKFKLDNGLTVLLHEDHSIPMVSYHTWYRVGSRDEWKGVTGAAHMLEHMMFKGAKKYSGKDFDRILHANGITNNAFTSHDYTGFYENLPSSKLELIMDVEVDRMKSLAISPDDLKSELQVVGEERRWRVDNNPDGVLNELIFDNLFNQHPYKWPVIGYMEDIQAYTSENLRKFYSTFYVPNNAVLVIAGDINPKEVKKMVEKYYGTLEAKPLPERKYPQDENLKTSLRKIVPWEVQSKTLKMAFRGVEAGNSDSYALDLLSTVLGGGKSSRLHKKLVYEEQTAMGVAAGNITNADPGFFSIYLAMKPGRPTESAENSILNEIASLKTKLVSDKELRKVKNQMMMDYVEGLNTIDGKAQTLAINEILFGDYQRFFVDLENYQKVSREDILRVARKYLDVNKRVTAILIPKAKK